MTRRSTAVFTIASANYLPYVKTLMQSVRDTNPAFRRYFFLVERKLVTNTNREELFNLVNVEDLNIDTFDDMVVRYDLMELNTAVKPFAIDWIFDNTDSYSAIYLDPDIFVYRPLVELEQLLSTGASTVLTPHLTRPAEDGRKPNDEHMLRAGVFNLGFIAVSRQAEAREFVSWWGRRLKNLGHADFANHQFTDQKWVDLAPCFLENVRILRSSAYNVAYWNLAQRAATRRDRKYYFDDEELAFFHFSGIELKKPTVVSKHQDRLKWSDIQTLHPLFNEYRARLKANGWAADASSAYTYEWIGGLKLTPRVRRLYRDLYPQPIKGTAIDETFLRAMCNQPSGIKHDTDGEITRLMNMIYIERSDLQAAYPMQSPQSVKAFATWFAESAEREYGLDACLASPPIADRQRAAAYRLPPMATRPRPNEERLWLYRRWRKVRRWMLDRI
jgi:hypothetical protein